MIKNNNNAVAHQLGSSYPPFTKYTAPRGAEIHPLGIRYSLISPGLSDINVSVSKKHSSLQ